MHGARNPAGPHAGDLANISIPEGGSLRVEQLAPNVQLGPGTGTLLDADGAAIVIHALADDYQTDPSGASGSRIACGVITR
jgi:Cu-Zn family superoxide dismutase